ncbi:MAG: hypothetical protein HRT57_05705 [Crocinitomicaceae bacterium]|nr:hypothetical protein [Crocinitomicaceae bacterium]
MVNNWKDNPTRYEVNPEILINSKQYDFSPTYTNSSYNELHFISDRSEEPTLSSGSVENKPVVYSSFKDKKGKWSEPVLVQGEYVNTEHESKSIVFNTRASRLYFTRCPNVKNQNLGCDIWCAAKKENTLTAPARVDFVCVKDPETLVNIENTALGKNDSYMVFSSNMLGGPGGKDLWIVRYDKKTKSWGAPSNVGPDVNTAGNDVYPVIRENGDLYFSSDGHTGMGGLDIFKAATSGDGKWSKVENLKFSINSSYDDSQIIFEGNSENGLFISNRAGGKGVDDIYNFRMPPVIH